jgi:hypothetical protein
MPSAQTRLNELERRGRQQELRGAVSVQYGVKGRIDCLTRGKYLE